LSKQGGALQISLSVYQQSPAVTLPHQDRHLVVFSGLIQQLERANSAGEKVFSLGTSCDADLAVMLT
jgi:hypothetical protein